eukprot:scaffold111104_cov28-Tisochrysis_lutea.AAC.1
MEWLRGLGEGGDGEASKCHARHHAPPAATRRWRRPGRPFERTCARSCSISVISPSIDWMARKSCAPCPPKRPWHMLQAGLSSVCSYALLIAPPVGPVLRV